MHIYGKSIGLIAIGVGWALSLGVGASERFAFVIPGDDTTSTVTDLSHLNSTPAGADGFVRIQDGKFYTDSARLKIWGVNTCFGANFPEKADAEVTAAHMAKLGINGLRMHHHDTAPAPRGIWGDVINGQRSLDPEMLDRQDYFLHQLHAHGIYVNLNLHVGRTLTKAEGFVSDDLPRSVRYDKYLLYYEPRMRQALKAFCRAYLLHYNPYRKCRRVDDPGIAMLEITNENAFSSQGPGIAATLPEPYRGEFKRQWNQWLERQYHNTAALKRAWRDTSEPLRDGLNASFDWRRSVSPWRLHNTQQNPYQIHLNQPGPQAEMPSIKVDFTQPAREVFQHELMLTDQTVEEDQLYTLSFWVKADAARTLYVDVSNQGPTSWHDLGLRESLTLTPQWTFVHHVFRARETKRRQARLCFKFGGSAVDFYLASLRFQRGGTFTVLPEGQTIEQQNIEIPDRSWTADAQQAAQRFMRDTEIAFIDDLMHFLKEQLGVKVPVTASQITYHDPDIVARTCDYADIHAYWEHPRFPGQPWDRSNWTIGNTPMEAVPLSDRLLSRSPWRLLDRPFTISEWNIPSPSDYAASVVPFAALVAGLQDWDGVFFFQYHSRSDNWDTDQLQSYFSFNGHPAKLALFTACAHLYRRSDLAPLSQALGGTTETMIPAGLGLDYRIGIDPHAGQAPPAQAPNQAQLGSLMGPAYWDATDKSKAYVQINTPKSRAVWGLIGNRTFTLDSLRIVVGPTPRNYAAIVMTSMDSRPLDQSRSILLTAVGSAENRNMGWNAQRTSVGSEWGDGPTQCNGIPASIQLANPHIKRVHALDGTGKRTRRVELSASDASGLSFDISSGYQTLWYELSR